MIKKFRNRLSITTRFFIWAIFIALLTTGCAKEPASKPAEPLRVVALVPAADDNLFWLGVVDVMQTAATSLGLSLDVVYGVNADRLLPTIQTLLTDYTKPDTLIFTYQPGVTLEALALAESYRLPSLLINTGLEGQALEDAQQRFTYWIGQITPPDELIGKKVAMHLLASAQSHTEKDKPAVVLALSAGKTDKAAIDRNRGLLAAMQDFPQARLAGIYETNWSAADAAQKLREGLAHHPEANAIWTVSGLMIPGILPVLQEAGLTPGEDISVATLGWTASGLEAVVQGLVVADVGGHVFEGGWAMVMLHDYLAEPWRSAKILRSPIAVLNQQNVVPYAEALSNKVWHQRDFSHFTLGQEADGAVYDFSIDTLLLP